MKPSLLIVIPTYGHFEYAARAVESAMANTKRFDPKVLVVDDFSPGPRGVSILPEVTAKYPSVEIAYLPSNFGYIYCCNVGLLYARQSDYEYCCIANSDVIFPENWDVEIFDGLEKYDLVGPVSNAPGSSDAQYVGHYSLLYHHKWPEDNIQKVQNELNLAQRGRFKEADLNGFCMISRTRTWWDHAYDQGHVFCPRNDKNSKGQTNPTPLMTLSEYEFQRRFKARHGRAAICLGSYVFHYRSVSRGDRYRQGDWARLKA